MRKEAATALTDMIAAAQAESLTISPLSGYRSYNTQVSVYNNEVKRYGQSVADTQSARPGTSEHQTGLAIDVGGGGCGIEDCFGNTPNGKWVAANAYKYGFIIRYTPGKESVTGYRPEPWHIRYIGTELATEMRQKGAQTLEEFFELPPAPSY
jgi:zinc D-Ala-D-Ala carboxypeptidase